MYIYIQIQAIKCWNGHHHPLSIHFYLRSLHSNIIKSNIGDFIYSCMHNVQYTHKIQAHRNKMQHIPVWATLSLPALCACVCVCVSQNFRLLIVIASNTFMYADICWERTLTHASIVNSCYEAEAKIQIRSRII